MKFSGTLAIVAIVLLTGCAQDVIHRSAIVDNLNKVLDRHDEYVNTGKNPDGSDMIDLEKRTYLGSSSGLRRVLEASDPNKPKLPPVDPVPDPAPIP